MDLSELHRLDSALGGITTLSQAIRAGAALRPQCKGFFFGPDDDCSCAIGAAAEALGYYDPLCPRLSLDPWIFVKRLLGVDDRILHWVIDTNDSGWTRERIADDLERRGL